MTGLKSNERLIDGGDKAGVRKAENGQYRIVDTKTGRLVTTRKGQPIDHGGMSRKGDAQRVAEKIMDSHERLGTKNHTVKRVNK